MKIPLWPFMLALVISCTGTTKITSVPIGWADDDTYTVLITDKNEIDAIKSAQHKILKDIVDVRVRNKSEYTDIVKIRDEFEIPLRHGKVLKRIQYPDRITIYYQIRDKDLKKKFQRQ